MLHGCTGTNKQGGGTLIGGVAGGLLGSKFGKGTGRLAATGIGALAGAFIGGQIGQTMDEHDRTLLELSSQKALEAAPIDQSVEWRNPDSGLIARRILCDLEEDTKVNIEYISANPTGPMHIGHARGAVYGDALAKVLDSTQTKKTKTGSQVDDLASSVILRYKQALTKEEIVIPEGLYPGEYLVDIGQKLVEKFGDKLLTMTDRQRHELVKDFAVEEMLAIIKQDLKELDIEHEVFFSEKSLYDSSKIDEVVQMLTKMGLIYEGQLSPPKGKIDESWDSRTQKLFKSTAFGDNQDRPIEKSDGSWSYFASDLAYAKDKIDRGFDHLVYILGADHCGYVKELRQ
ncbi:hypothetical protein J6590_078289 [Homalodisca vitripennis]|nr:hypothetical protein J6590_078289 [Homalodisca vitripennis]